MKYQSLYRPDCEHDACGVGMIVNIHGNKTHELVESALDVLENMQHRGAEGADKNTGDGAGVLLQIPHEFILLQGIPVPEQGRYGTGLIFLPKEEEVQHEILSILIEEIERQGLSLMHMRAVPVNSDVLGQGSGQTEPAIRQVFITAPGGRSAQGNLELKLYIIRKKVERRVHHRDFYVASLSSRCIVYKGMLSSLQVRQYFRDLTQPYFTSGLAIVHSRFSTNTFPTWSLAQPFRMLAHNGEINTIRGNRLWMQARETILTSQAFGDIDDVLPILQEGMSDSASLDNVLEFLVVSGLSLPHAMAMLVPEATDDKNPISADLKAFYEYHSILMEPWDGPATLLFTDGRYAGGMLDRNGLRPARYLITHDDTLVIASETGVIGCDPSNIREKGRLSPGKMLLVDTQEGRIYYDAELKQQLAAMHPYRQWLDKERIELDALRSGRKISNTVEDYSRRLRLFGYTQEDIDDIIGTMCTTGAEPVAAMGNDTPMAVLTNRPQLLFNYFYQLFAQVTNPGIDPIREQLVMSLAEYVGSVGINILKPEERHCKMVRLPQPILTNAQLDILRNIRYKGFTAITLPTVFEAKRGRKGLKEAINTLCSRAEQSVADGADYIVLSDRTVDARHAAIPTLLAVSAVHHHLIRVRKRCETAIIVESGEVREVMHAALLLGYGASAINPYMAFAVIDDLVRGHKVQMNYEAAEQYYIRAMCGGLLKVMSRMGISTLRSYRGAQLFEAVGLSEELLSTYFGIADSTIGGVGLKEIARDYVRLHTDAYGMEEEKPLPSPGQYKYVEGGLRHAWTPENIRALQLATRSGDYEKYKVFADLVNKKEHPIALRDFFRLPSSPIAIDEVEPVDDIVKHFVTGAISFGAISREAHEALAEAMNRIGSRSNTGEGGEEPHRFHAEVDGISLSSRVKQVASGRFGVTTHYLVNADELQIKVAQGAHPGDGGMLMGVKVDSIIARTRHSLPGATLVSPSPHHDIYSIEDLAQLIYDLKNVNPRAAISVKLAAESGVGTVAAGVAKSKADLIVISGAGGGTGGSLASSIRYAGIDPEIGVAEAQQTLVLNGLRSKVRLQVDGGLKTGRDVVTLALLGAEEFAFGTAALVVLGCSLNRQCHTNKCPMGVATQDAEARSRFEGSAEYVVRYFRFLAQEVRELLADMGFRHLSDIVGRTDLIGICDCDTECKMAHLDFSRILHREGGDAPQRFISEQQHDLAQVKDQYIIRDAQPALTRQRRVQLDYTIANTDRAVGAMLSGVVASRYGESGLPDDSIQVKFRGSAGQSFGAFLTRGITFRLEGDANDYLGKGLSGGRIAVVTPMRAGFAAERNTIAGNTLLYGATSGELYINGCVGERFAVRNSGATAVVEGVGDHCCEYMTDGRVVVLGRTGRNFAAGMTGGVAYVWDADHHFDYFCNMAMVEIALIEDEASREELHELICHHYQYTGSHLARTMLDDWQNYVGQFIKVTPTEYKHVLLMQQQQRLRQKIADAQREYEQMGE